MRWFESIWNFLLPATNSVILRGGAGLVIATSLGLAVSFLALMVTWAISRDLQRQTVVAFLAFLIALAGISALARSGRFPLAAGILVALLTLATTVEVARYGVKSVSAAGYLISIALAAHSLGALAGFGIALFGTLVAWLLAWGETAGWYKPPYSPEISHLTFNAPALTVLFFLMALITSF